MGSCHFTVIDLSLGPVWLANVSRWPGDLGAVDARMFGMIRPSTRIFPGTYKHPSQSYESRILS